MNKIIVFIVAFLIIGGYLIIINNDYDLENDSQDREDFLKDFSGWVVNLGKNAKDVGGVVKEKEWLPQDYEENSVNETVK